MTNTLVDLAGRKPQHLVTVLSGTTEEEYAQAVWDLLAKLGYVDGKDSQEWAENIGDLGQKLFEEGMIEQAKVTPVSAISVVNTLVSAIMVA